MHINHWSLLPVLLGLLAWLPVASGEESGQVAQKADDSPGIKNSGWQPIFKEMAADYRIASPGKSDHPYTLHLPPVFRWTQPVRGGDDGAVYVWLDRGRVAVVGTIFAWPQSDGMRVVQHEFHSFTDGPLEAVWRDRTVWSPAKGVERAALPDAPEPATGAAQRLRQIKTLAGGFTGNSIGPDGGRWELRLLSNPLYRYALDETEEVLDGALFTLTQGTDPEVLILIEARRVDGEYKWQYCLGRFSDYKLAVRYRDREIWTVGPGDASTPREPYTWLVAEIREKPKAE
ncbi:MAG TPA: hypothetical protein VHC22_16945 [Pirellulales bacterium]|nr:hypothetical protein [Pirellulales bacterium]